MKIAVVGCGLAGLRSAMLAEAAGHEVTLFEARNRPGGRLHTAPSGFEEGAEWIDADQERMRSLLSELSIAEVPAQPGEYVLQFRGKRCMESIPWPGAAADLRSLNALAASDLQGETLADLVNEACTSEEGKWLASANIRTDEGDEPRFLGFQQWREYQKLYANRQGAEYSAYRIDGGAQRLVERLLSKIETTPTFGAALQSVNENAFVELVFDGFTARADAAIIALPLPCLLDIRFDPPLAVAPELGKLGFAPAIKARFHFDAPFWKHEGWYGYMKSDLLVQQTWPDREDPRALVGYIVGDAAREIESSTTPEAILSKEWLKWERAVVPSRVEVKNWTRDPFARGAFTLAAPGSNPAAARERTGGRVQLAGEFAAEWMGFMEGALESAETAVSALS